MTHPITYIKNSWLAYKRDWRAWLVLVSPLAGIAIIFTALDAFGADIFSRAAWTGLAVVIAYALLALVSIFIGVAFSNAAVYSAMPALAGKKPEFREATRAGIKLFWPLLWIGILRGLIIAGGLLLLVVPGIIWAVRYSLSCQVAILEGKRGLSALRRSRELTSGRWFETAINMLFIGLTFGLGSWLATALFIFVIIVFSGLLSLVVPNSAADGVRIAVNIVALLGQAAILWLTIPFSPLAVTAVYKEYAGK